MKRKSLIISAMIAALAIGLLESGPANAQGLGGDPGMMQGPGAGRRAVVLPGFDTDGVITPIGLQQARQQFAQRGQGTGQDRGRGGQGQGRCGQGTGLGGQGRVWSRVRVHVATEWVPAGVQVNAPPGWVPVGAQVPADRVRARTRVKANNRQA